MGRGVLTAVLCAAALAVLGAAPAAAVTPVLKGTICECFLSREYGTRDATGEVAFNTAYLQAQCVRHEGYHEPSNCTCFNTLYVSCTFHVSTAQMLNTTEVLAIPDIQARILDLPNGTVVVDDNMDDTDPPCSGCDGADGIHVYHHESYSNRTRQRAGVTSWSYIYYEETNIMPCVGNDPCPGSPINCVTEYIGNWSECSHPCGGGSQTIQLGIVTHPQNGGVACPSPLLGTQRCNLQSCPVDCQVGSYGPFSACSLSCKDPGGAEPQTGTRTRSRAITTPPSGGGAACPALVDTEVCTPPDCTGTGVDCDFTTAVTTPCDAACEAAGVEISTITIVTQASGGGAACPTGDELTVSASCTGGPCPDVDCLVNTGEYGACSSACGGGTQTAPLTVVQAPSGNGTACPSPLTATRPCNIQGCPVDCVVSVYSAFTSCSLPCRPLNDSLPQTGVQRRTRTVVVQPANGGAECPALLDEQVCLPEVCSANATLGDVDCAVSLIETVPCTGVCEATGTRTEVIVVQVPAQGEGAPCPTGGDLTVVTACAGSVCHCEGTYSNYSECTVNGTQSRLFNIAAAPSEHGTACPAPTETRECTYVESEDDPAPTSSDGGGLSAGAIAGIAVGATAVVAAGATAVVMALKTSGQALQWRTL